MTGAHVVGVAVLGSGLPDWAAARAVLAGTEPWHGGEVVLPPPALLSATERRRTGPAVRLALAVASAAASASGIDPATLRPVFASGNGDGNTVAAILDAMARPDGFVSPTQFHNSVHNAAAGYWSIGTASNQPATCLGGHDWSFGCGLLKAVAECAAGQHPVLLCAYDLPLPSPIDAKRPTGPAFGAAFVLVPAGHGPRLSIEWYPQPATRAEPLNPALRDLAAGNPAARSLRLLEALARGGSDAFDVALLDGSLGVTVSE